MKIQNYKNHVRYYVPHHLIFYPLVLLFIIISAVGIVKDPENMAMWGMFLAVWVMITFLAFMVRQHYALTLQNRLVLSELRFRYYVLTQKHLGILEDRLSFPQLAALRFAPDEELLPLIDRAVNEKLSADQIKKAIKNWKADNKRV